MFFGHFNLTLRFSDLNHLCDKTLFVSALHYLHPLTVGTSIFDFILPSIHRKILIINAWNFIKLMMCTCMYVLSGVMNVAFYNNAMTCT